MTTQQTEKELPPETLNRLIELGGFGFRQENGDIKWWTFADKKCKPTEVPVPKTEQVKGSDKGVTTVTKPALVGRILGKSFSFVDGVFHYA